MKNIEILSPAGDMDALIAAINSGADAVYLGLDIFNARIRAKNFTLETVDEAIRLCHAQGVKVYVTLNTQLYNKELSLMLDYVCQLYNKGVDALIVADFGVASLIKEYFDDFEIHASTQASVHNRDGAELLSSSLGFSRVVLARELDKESIEYISKNAEYETEIFVHGAHCMSVSGQCLLSYCLGGRSGNRGECAQPCRLPYSVGKNNGYHLSLKDMSLCGHIPEILDSGAKSLKIEGRMKSDTYVGGVVSIWRKLIDGKRNATKGELSTLSALFSRGGFTDGYFTSSINSSMLGIRSQLDKDETEKIKEEKPVYKKSPVMLFARFCKGEKSSLTIKHMGKEYTAFGDIVEEAIKAPMSKEDIEKNLIKLGATPFYPDKVEIVMDEGIMVRNSSINALRRACIDEIFKTGRENREVKYEAMPLIRAEKMIKTALFNEEEQIPENCDYFDVRIVPIERYKGCDLVNGVMLPAVILDREWNEITSMLEYAKKKGVKYAVASNIGQIKRLKSLGFDIIGDFRFNAFNVPCVNYLRKEGVSHLILSPELTLAQLKDFYGYGVIAYGKIPMLTSHKCFLKDTVGCDKCKGYIKDRQGAMCFAQGTFGHRSVMYNSVPVYMADKQGDINKYSYHFIFTDEDKGECYEIIEAYKKQKPTTKGMRRIK